MIFLAPTDFTALVPVNVPRLRAVGPAAALAPQLEPEDAAEAEGLAEGGVVFAADRAAETLGSTVRGFLEGGRRFAIMGLEAVW